MEAGNYVNKELMTNEELTNEISGKPWTKNKRNMTAKYTEKLEYRRTTFSKKWKAVKKLAEQLASQTGAQLKIIIFNLDNNKTETIHKRIWGNLKTKFAYAAKSTVQAVTCYSFTFKRIDIT